MFPTLRFNLGPALFLAALLLTLVAAGCAGLTQRDPVRVNVAGVEPLPGEGMEVRMMVKLRVQNPTDSAIDFDGIALELEVGDKLFASGVSDRKGSVPRFGEDVIEVPVSISTLAVVRQALRVFDGKPATAIPYVLRGRLGGGTGARRGMRFSDSGTLDLPGFLETTPQR